MDLDKLTLGEAKQLNSLLAGAPASGRDSHPYKLGVNYLIRTVTFYYIGRLVSILPQELVLVDAAWVADTGRFMNALKDGTLAEVEPYPDEEEVVIGRGSIVDAVRWRHDLPRVQK